MISYLFIMKIKDRKSMSENIFHVKCPTVSLEQEGLVTTYSGVLVVVIKQRVETSDC